jgi:hypothetical protein
MTKTRIAPLTMAERVTHSGPTRKQRLALANGGTYKVTPANAYNPVRKAPSQRDLWRMEVKERGL